MVGQNVDISRPPYFKKGRDLYYDFYSSSDHADVAAFVKERLRIPKCVVSYDNVAEIRAPYDGWRYTIGYSARSANEGSEVMFFSDNLLVSEIVGSARPIRGFDEPQGRKVVEPR
jgi:hypothetical protein